MEFRLSLQSQHHSTIDSEIRGEWQGHAIGRTRKTMLNNLCFQHLPGLSSGQEKLCSFSIPLSGAFDSRIMIHLEPIARHAGKMSSTYSHIQHISNCHWFIGWSYEHSSCALTYPDNRKQTHSALRETSIAATFDTPETHVGRHLFTLVYHHIRSEILDIRTAPE